MTAVLVCWLWSALEATFRTWEGPAQLQSFQAFLSFLAEYKSVTLDMLLSDTHSLHLLSSGIHRSLPTCLIRERVPVSHTAVLPNDPLIFHAFPSSNQQGTCPAVRMFAPLIPVKLPFVLIYRLSLTIADNFPMSGPLAIPLEYN